jgi:hypothetical protein
MILNVLFWLLVAADAAALALFFLLGLAAAKPSHTSPISVVVFTLVPALILLVAIAVFLKANSTVWRLGALVLAASPALLTAAGWAYAQWDVRGYLNADGSANSFKAGPNRDLEAAIAAKDPSAIATAAKKADINQAGLAEATPLLLAIRQLEKSPKDLDAVRILLEAGAGPNASNGADLPLVAAIRMSRFAGLEPVRMLLKAGAKPNQLGTYGTPAYFSACGITVDVEVLKLLLDSGADLNITEKSGSGALMHATNARNWKALLLLLERGADWRKVRTLNGEGLLDRLESDARNFGDGQGLAEVIRFVKSAA